MAVLGKSCEMYIHVLIHVARVWRQIKKYVFLLMEFINCIVDHSKLHKKPYMISQISTLETELNISLYVEKMTLTIAIHKIFF